MTDEELQQIRERCDRATPGPWQVHGFDVIGAERVKGQLQVIVEDNPYDGGGIREEVDVEFIAHARADIPALLSALEQAQRESAAQYVKGWNDGEADAEKLRVERDALLSEIDRLKGEITRLEDAAKDWRRPWE